MIKYLKKLFNKPEPESISFQVDLPPWENHHAHELHAFFKTDTGSLFLQHLKRHQIDVNSWAVDTSQEAYDNMKYRGCVAYGTKLHLDKILSMSRAEPENKKRELSDKQVETWFNKRMGIYKS
jgi:hypothetical protein